MLVLVPRAGVEPARPFSGKRRILSPQCLPISPSGRRLTTAAVQGTDLHGSVAWAVRVCNALSHPVTQWRHRKLPLHDAKKKGKPKLPF
jgi:hypothetical protein